MKRSSVLRVLDANANRALEGMRVCEEIVRFHLAAPRQLRTLRALRHAIAHAVTQLPVRRVDLLAARDSTHDPGRRATASAVQSFEQLLVINFQRVKESLRTLEECTRVLAPRQTAVFQSLRFRTYGVERDTVLYVATVRHH